MTSLLPALFFTGHIYCQARPDVQCKGLDVLPVNSFLVLNQYVQKEVIRKSDLISYDLYIGTTDTTCKVTGFIMLYDCNSCSQIKLGERIHPGNKIQAGDPFIRRFGIGNQFSIDCVNVEKNGIRYKIRGASFTIIE